MQDVDAQESSERTHSNSNQYCIIVKNRGFEIKQGFEFCLCHCLPCLFESFSSGISVVRIRVQGARLGVGEGLVHLKRA